MICRCDDPGLYLFGLTDLKDIDNPSSNPNLEIGEPDQIFIHPNYIKDIADDWDIALVKLKTPLTITHHVRTICIPSKDMVFTPGTMCTVTGWGKTENEGRSYDNHGYKRTKTMKTETIK